MNQNAFARPPMDYRNQLGDAYAAAIKLNDSTTRLLLLLNAASRYQGGPNSETIRAISDTVDIIEDRLDAALAAIDRGLPVPQEQAKITEPVNGSHHTDKESDPWKPS